MLSRRQKRSQWIWTLADDKPASGSVDVGSHPKADVFERRGIVPSTSADHADSDFRWTSIAAFAAQEMAVQRV
jgi:hypothetical protein